MALTSRKNLSVKALQARMASKKKHSDSIRLEWELSCNTNANRGHIFNQSEIHELYDRDNWESDARHGATKTCHLKNHFGEAFKYIVVKRHQTNGYIDEHADNPNTKQTGNQLIDEINCWNEYAETEYSDLLCPILKYFTSKSDKVSAISEKMQNNVVIIAQRAVFVGNAARACERAAELNAEHGIHNVETEDERYRKMRKMSTMNGWRDAMENRGNSGVIYDYHKNCYKAVFIDYAL